VACTECHTVPTSLDHPDGTAQIRFGPRASQDTTPSWTHATATCASTYCHGATLPGGSNTAPDWRGGSAETACGSCHGRPPPAPHPGNPNCGGCHGSGYSATTVNVATHVDGHLDLVAFTCSSCHGDSTRIGPDLLKAAPPAGSGGETLTTQLAVGAHQAHLTDGGLASAVACTECHVVPTSTSHPDGSAQVQFGPRATQGGATPAWDHGTATCSSTYCHGNYSGTFTYTMFEEVRTWTYSGNDATPTWTAGAACGSCHGAPPAGTWHSEFHGHNAAQRTCETCHPDAAGQAGSALITNPALHVNGVVEVTPRFVSDCFNCH